ncbi:MAG: hypothetical protein JWP44_1120 [Mucilaginibacter sp.]|nr:hypothetical protein [Mucilaginibacter sp.]
MGTGDLRELLNQYSIIAMIACTSSVLNGHMTNLYTKLFYITTVYFYNNYLP